MGSQWNVSMATTMEIIGTYLEVSYIIRQSLTLLRPQLFGEKNILTCLAYYKYKIHIILVDQFRFQCTSSDSSELQFRFQWTSSESTGLVQILVDQGQILVSYSSHSSGLVQILLDQFRFQWTSSDSSELQFRFQWTSSDSSELQFRFYWTSSDSSGPVQILVSYSSDSSGLVQILVDQFRFQWLVG